MQVRCGDACVENPQFLSFVDRSIAPCEKCAYEPDLRYEVLEDELFVVATGRSFGFQGTVLANNVPGGKGVTQGSRLEVVQVPWHGFLQPKQLRMFRFRRPFRFGLPVEL